LHMAQQMPLPLIVSCFSKIQIGFTFLVPAHLGSPGQRAVKRVCECVCQCSLRQPCSKLSSVVSVKPAYLLTKHGLQQRQANTKRLAIGSHQPDCHTDVRNEQHSEPNSCEKHTKYWLLGCSKQTHPHLSCTQADTQCDKLIK